MNKDVHTFSYPDARSIVVCGDIHGDFNFLIYKLCVQYGMKNTLLIVAATADSGSKSRATMRTYSDEMRQG